MRGLLAGGGGLVGQRVDGLRGGEDGVVHGLLRVRAARQGAEQRLAGRPGAAREASSGRVAEETPSQTIATEAGAPSGSTVQPTEKASSLRWWRRPRSLTAATGPDSCSMWSRSRGWACPQFSQ